MRIILSNRSIKSTIKVKYNSGCEIKKYFRLEFDDGDIEWQTSYNEEITDVDFYNRLEKEYQKLIKS
jgi:hypothetical protein